jgi:phosphoadenosine phosphosulfate reductase
MSGTLAKTKLRPDLEPLDASGVLEYVVDRFHPRLAVACSFQKESVVVLDLLLRIAPDARVFTLDTHVLFPETYETWRQLEERYGIQFEVHEGPSLGRQAALHGDRLWARNPDKCCDLRKVQPLVQALSDVDAWVSGRARRHGQASVGRQAREVEGEPAGGLDRGGRVALHPPPRPPVQPPPRSGLRVDRLHALHQARGRS